MRARCIGFGAAWRERLCEPASLDELRLHALDLLVGSAREAIDQQRDEALGELRV